MLATDDEVTVEQDTPNVSCAPVPDTPEYKPIPDPGPIELLVKCLLDGTYKPIDALRLARGYDGKRWG